MAERAKLSGQFKWNPDTGDLTATGSKASDRPVKEQQGNLLDWGEETQKLNDWKRASGPPPEETPEE